jgi:hypothetical protein
MAGNPWRRDDSNPHPHRSEQPLKPCDKCDKTGELVGGVQVREKWYCAKCWIKLINSR